MMLFLSQDIGAHLLQMRSVYRESAISFLPRETAESEFLVDPARGLAFEFPHHISQAMGGAQSGEDVDMITGSADRVWHAVKTPDHAAKILVHAEARSGRKPWLAIFGAKDEMVMERERDGSRAWGSFSCSCRSSIAGRPVGTGGYGRRKRPAPPANICRPSGTNLLPDPEVTGVRAAISV